MSRFRGKNVILPKYEVWVNYELWVISNSVCIEQAKFCIIDQEKRDSGLDRGKNKVYED